MLRRRDLFGLAASGLFLPRRLLAAPPANERKFLFIYCYGGWDTSMVYSPMFDVVNASVEGDAAVATARGITYVDSPQRPNVKAFFETWGDRACMINGMEVRSVTHERCQRILMTGSAESGKDDWPAIAAGNGAEGLLLPHLVNSGPAFSTAYSDRIVRVGENGQLIELLDGTALDRSAVPVTPPSADAQSLGNAYLTRRLESFRAGAGAGAPATFADHYAGALSDIDALRAMSGTLNLDPASGGCSRDIASDAATALDCFALGISRCAITRHDGWCAVGWDTHVSNSYQTLHYDELFGFLDQIMTDLDGRTGVSGAPLRDEVTIVVLSEMGRHPTLNSGGGKDHWTFTSCLLIGSGIRGGQTLGELDENALGRPIDLATGELDEGGEALLPTHLGASLLTLADLDPAEFLTSGAPILAALDG